MRQNALWEPPCLCGCILHIWADWAESQNGHTYAHPIPFSITNIEIVKVCDGHQEWTKSMPDVSRHYEDKHPYTGKPYQARGYLAHPIVNPTDAQCLYENLCIYNGQLNSFPCGCSAYQYFDHEGNFCSYIDHPRHTRKCCDHEYDTEDMKQAALDYAGTIQ